MADWHTFNEEAAAMHIFMANTRDEEAKRACYKILTELPQGDVGLLMTKITTIEAFPEHKPPTSVKPVINPICYGPLDSTGAMGGGNSYPKF